MKTVPRFLLIAALVCALPACDKEAATQPDALGPALGLVGEWSGNIGPGELELVFDNQRKTLTGVVTMNFDGQPYSYSFEGIRWDNPQEFWIDLPCEDGCVRLLFGQTLDAETLRGSYTEEHPGGGNNFFRRWSATKKTGQGAVHRLK